MEIRLEQAYHIHLHISDDVHQTSLAIPPMLIDAEVNRPDTATYDTMIWVI